MTDTNSMSGEFDSELNNSAGYNSFWDVKQYLRCVRRLENGNKLCSDVCNMIQDRVEIEKNYYNSFHKWSSKWSTYLDNGSEYGTTKSCWTGWCNEAEALSDLHKDIRNKLIDEVQSEVRNWQKEHFHKAALPPQHIKEAKSLESDFEIAQKPWSKKLKKMYQCKKDYHQQCKLLRSCEVHSKNALNDSSLSQEQVKKTEEKFKKAEKDSEKTKALYEASLLNLSDDCSRYTTEMTKVFIKSQSMERERMAFFKSVFFKIQKILNLSENKNLPNIYYEYEKSIEGIDPDLDVKQWSQSYGIDMPFICPQFEEYSPELHSISKKKFSQTHDSGVTLTAINTMPRQSSVRSGDNDVRSAKSPSFTTVASSPSPNLDLMTPTLLDTQNSNIDDEIVPLKPRRLVSVDEIYSSIDFIRNDASLFGNKESPVFSDDCGIQVRALYDYNGIEDDELTLIEGEIFLKLEDEDEQGWCKGKKDGRIGLYPANYAELV